MASEIMFPANVKVNDKIMVDGKAQTVVKWEVWEAVRDLPGPGLRTQEIRLYAIHFEPYHTTTGTVRPHPLWVPMDQVVEVIR